MYCFLSIFLRIWKGKKENIADHLGKERDKIKFHGLSFQNFMIMNTTC